MMPSRMRRGQPLVWGRAAIITITIIIIVTDIIATGVMMQAARIDIREVRVSDKAIAPVGNHAGELDTSAFGRKPMPVELDKSSNFRQTRAFRKLSFRPCLSGDLCNF
jgi:hypothetical protein